jgi:hypothetical protein
MTEGETKKGQPRDTNNIGHKTQNEDKQNKNTTQQVLGTTLHKQTEGTQDEDKQNKNTTQ